MGSKAFRMNMSGSPVSGQNGENAPADVLEGARYRQVLAILLECSDPVPLETLAQRLSDDDVHATQVDLYHRCLPRLEAVGWVTRRPDGVTTTEQCPLRAGQASALHESNDRFWDALSTVGDRPRRRAIVSLLVQQDRSLSLDRLAMELQSRGNGSQTTTEHEDISDIHTALYHVDIPQLADAGLIKYHANEGQIAPTEFAKRFLDSEIGSMDGFC